MTRNHGAAAVEATKELNFTNERRIAKRVTGSRTFIRSAAAAASTSKTTVALHGDAVFHGAGFVECLAQKSAS